jgi:hypothetical protein
VAGWVEIYSFSESVFGRRQTTSRGRIMGFGLHSVCDLRDPYAQTVLGALGNLAFGDVYQERHGDTWSVSPARAAELHRLFTERWPVEREREGEYADWYDISVSAALAVLGRAMKQGERVGRMPDSTYSDRHASPAPPESRSCTCSMPGVSRPVSAIEAVGLGIVAVCAWRGRRMRRRTT